MDETLFITVVRSLQDRDRAGLLVESLRAFGGALAGCPVWVFEANPGSAPCGALAGEGVTILPLELPGTVRHYYFAAKVWACARAEELAGREGGPLFPGRVESLVWMAPDCLVIQPPVLFALGPKWDAAVRPVHVRNVGLRAGEPQNPFWRGVYAAVGVEDVAVTVESYVEGQRLRAYYNSHAFAVDPALGLLGRWAEVFETLVVDRAFQAAACQDAHHQVFLHQAVLSTLLATTVDPARLRLLPPEYSYPYNLHAAVPKARRARALDDLVSIAYEDRSLDPAEIEDIAVGEPLRSWLAGRRVAGEGEAI
jgi:hypothetical protein